MIKPGQSKTQSKVNFDRYARLTFPYEDSTEPYGREWQKTIMLNNLHRKMLLKLSVHVVKTTTTWGLSSSTSCQKIKLRRDTSFNTSIHRKLSFWHRNQVCIYVTVFSSKLWLCLGPVCLFWKAIGEWSGNFSQCVTVGHCGRSMWQMRINYTVAPSAIWTLEPNVEMHHCIALGNTKLYWQS